MLRYCGVQGKMADASGRICESVRMCATRGVVIYHPAFHLCRCTARSICTGISLARGIPSILGALAVRMVHTTWQRQFEREKCVIQQASGLHIRCPVVIHLPWMPALLSVPLVCPQQSQLPQCLKKKIFSQWFCVLFWNFNQYIVNAYVLCACECVRVCAGGRVWYVSFVCPDGHVTAQALSCQEAVLLLGCNECFLAG